MQLRFVPSESTASYFEVLHSYLQTHGCPVAFYSDKHSVFRVNRPDTKNGSGMTQFGRALAELNIEIICANSSQAKGRVERANRTLQDRLVKELRLENVCDMEAGNAFLPGFVERFNKQFARKPAAPADLHRRVTDPSRLNDVLSQREQRHVSEQLTLSYDRKQLILERNEISEELGGKYVEVYAFPDGRLEVRSNGHVLPYRVFNKDQRVSPTAIVERKRLSHALSIIKAKQEATPVPKVQTNSEKNGYRKNLLDSQDDHGHVVELFGPCCPAVGCVPKSLGNLLQRSLQLLPDNLLDNFLFPKLARCACYFQQTV